MLADDPLFVAMNDVWGDKGGMTFKPLFSSDVVHQGSAVVVQQGTADDGESDTGDDNNGGGAAPTGTADSALETGSEADGDSEDVFQKAVKRRRVERRTPAPKTPPKPTTGEAIEAGLKLLQRIGFLRPTTELEDVVYELSMPGLGKLITAVTKTRVDLLGVLRRTKHKETFEHQLKKLKLRHTSFDLEYHLSEMEGKGLIRRTRVTSGTLVTLVQK
ncbi:hypothetical protein P43SY_000358 [Pythium insidiosum]|uniref:Uncharacterized protein n=1 Tax=Pythium insidiosum TaxID=114742 RepID=A0AAD5MFR2_PYTIN|nr:hypothetical protein P43SY_000358 [Pythium insidiosum]